MVQDVVATAETSERFAEDIRIEGKTAVYGIYFDTDKTDIRPESGPTHGGMVHFPVKLR